MPYILKIKGQIIGGFEYDKTIQAIRLQEYPEGPTIGKIPMSIEEWNKDFKKLSLIEQFDLLKTLYGD